MRMAFARGKRSHNFEPKRSPDFRTGWGACSWQRLAVARRDPLLKPTWRPWWKHNDPRHATS
eukprot:2385571-Pyramimonas_sp.AAC.1